MAYVSPFVFVTVATTVAVPSNVPAVTVPSSLTLTALPDVTA